MNNSFFPVTEEDEKLLWQIRSGEKETAESAYTKASEEIKKLPYDQRVGKDAALFAKLCELSGQTNSYIGGKIGMEETFIRNLRNIKFRNFLLNGRFAEPKKLLCWRMQ